MNPIPQKTALPIVVTVLLAALSLSACNKQSTSYPSNPAASVGSGTGSASGNASSQPSSSSGAEVQTPAAPDARGGGSSGFKGSVPTPDTSGGPSSGSNSAGASTTGAPSSAASAPVSPVSK